MSCCTAFERHPAEKAIIPHVGEVATDDSKALCGLYSLLLAEWLPNVAAFLKL
jgi:hypothetical protein